MPNHVTDAGPVSNLFSLLLFSFLVISYKDSFTTSDAVCQLESLHVLDTVTIFDSLRLSGTIWKLGYYMKYESFHFIVTIHAYDSIIMIVTDLSHVSHSYPVTDLDI